MNCRQVVVAGALVVGSVAVGQPAQAMPPPVEFALKMVAEGAEERRQSDWQLVVVDQGVRTMCGSVAEESARFEGDGHRMVIDSGSEDPWGLLWAALWADDPGGQLRQYQRQWTAQSAHYVAMDRELVQCWGADSQVCIDRGMAQIVNLDVDAGGHRWQVRITGEGQRVQITRDGSQFGRLVAGGCHN